METYSPDQIAQTWKFVPRPPSWFVSVGLGYGDECERVKARYPQCQVVGIDPHPVVYKHHEPIVQGSAVRGVCVKAAVSDDVGVTVLRFGDEDNRSSVCRFGDDRPGVPVLTLSLDFLDHVYGPFDRTYLWMDCEGAEAAALRGAKNLFGRRAVDVVNVECLLAGLDEIDGLLTEYDMVHVHSWNGGPHGDDRVCVRRDLLPLLPRHVRGG